MRVIRGILSSIVITILLLQSGTGMLLAANPMPSGVVISEISMGSEDSASDEFVELYNNSSVDITLSGWAIYYKSSTGKTWTKKANFTENSVIHAHDFYLIASSRLGADVSMTSGMSQTSGIIQIRDNTGSTIDLVGWGSADTFEEQSAPSTQAGEVLYRSFDTTALIMQDSDNNFDDLSISANETPKAAPHIEVPTPDVTVTYPKVALSELFPNPASPQEDNQDEFIELYNPNNIPVDLNGWIVRDAGGSSYVIKDKIIPAMGYAVFTSKESSLSLNNTGDVIYLFSPDNTLVDSSADYSDAKEGLSWAVVGNSWDWTVSPTPSTVNSATYIEVDSSKTAASKTTSKKTTTAKKAAKASSKVAAKAKKPASSSNPQDVANSAAGNSNNSLVWSWLLIVLGVGTIGYGIYEYRPEIIGVYHRLITKFRNRS